MKMDTAEKTFLTILLNQDKTGFKAGETSSKEMINSSSQKKQEEEKEEKIFFKFIDAEKESEAKLNARASAADAIFQTRGWFNE